jgi:hypothetical protein
MSQLKKLTEKIDALNKALSREYARMAEKYGFSIQQRTVTFLKEFRERNKKFRIPAWKYVVPTDVRHLISMPFIYIMIVPVVILDIFLTVYNRIALPLYRIPVVKRREYIIYDRQFLSYLNLIQKFNCLYCSYANGLMSYGTEIAARTERYWCPVKAAHKPIAHHGWYGDFADYGNPREWEERFNDSKAFQVCPGTKNGESGEKEPLQ